MNRKDFLKMLGVGAAALAGGSLAACAPEGAATVAGAGQKHWTWLRGDYADLDTWKRTLAQFRGYGIDAVLYSASPKFYQTHAAAAAEEGIELHAWMFTMMRGENADEHPEWYAVSRDGKSTATDPPYVDYYRFMCPTRAPVRDYLRARVDELAAIDGIGSVHLDYVRFPDVILPSALWPTYDIVQDREYPPYDFCYCDVCRETFAAQSGRDPLDLEDPAADPDWLQFRYDRITTLVNDLAATVHARDTALTAAVFPTPDIARTLVRQEWARWDLDAVLPMIYNWFYEEDVPWVGLATAEGVTALDGRIPLYSGLYVPELTPTELAAAAEYALDNGAQGVALFEGSGTSEAHWQALAEVIAA